MPSTYSTRNIRGYLKAFLFFILLCAFNRKTTCQGTTKQNPILFGSFLLGHAAGGGGGFSLGTEANVQARKNLFTLQYLSTLKVRTSFAFYIFPVIEEKSSQQTVSLLYGRRFIDKGMATSFSAGISYNLFREYVDVQNKYVSKPGAGCPFEANIQWFKPEKSRFRIVYGLIPVGEPTGFGRSIGFKFFGNVSKHSFAGISLTAGLGLHKKY